MRGFLIKLIKRLGFLAVALVIVLAIAVVGFRLLVAELPGYRDDIQDYVTEALGVTLDFDSLDARLGLRGPELTFHDATVGALGEQEPFVSARRAMVGIDALALLRERRIAFNRLTLDGTRLVLVREEDGTLRLQGAPFDPAAREQWDGRVPASVEVAVRDSEVLYMDRAAGTSWHFQDVAGELTRSAGKLVLSARARPPAELASRIELTAEGELARGGAVERWSLLGTVRDADLAAVSGLLPREPVLDAAGTGNLSVRLEWSEGRIAELGVRADLRDVMLPAAEAQGTFYSRVRGQADWARDRDGWRLFLSDVDVYRNGLDWRRLGRAQVRLGRDARGLRQLSLSSDFLRLEDLTPVLSVLPQEDELSRWLRLEPRGEIEDLELTLERTPRGWDYAVSGEFAGLAAEPVDEWPGFTGLTGELRADSRSGRVSIVARDVALDWPALFRAPLAADELSGVLVWREGREGYRLVSDDLALSNADGSVRSNLELTWPLDGGSPTLDFEASVTGLHDVNAVKRYLPARRMSEGLVSWLDDAIQGGRAPSARVTLFGPLDAFPFDGGEGQLHVRAEVEDGVLEYVGGWPRAEELTGTIEFRDATFEARGRGRVLGNESSNAVVRIDDLRENVLTLNASTSGPLTDVVAFIDGAPLIADHLGPDFARLSAEEGIGEVGLDLRLPLKEPSAFELAATLAVDGGALAVDGRVAASEITGTLELANGTVHAEQVQAVLFGGPVTARLSIPGPPGHQAQLEVDGEIAASRVAELLDLPLGERIGGQTRWHGRLLLPVRSATRPAPVLAHVSSNLSGIALDFPAPLEKQPSEANGLRVDFELLEGQRLVARGALGAARRFALEFEDAGAGFAFRRGAVRFGGDSPELPMSAGLVIDGVLPSLDFDVWLAATRSTIDTASLNEWLLGLNLDVQEMTALGQALGQARISAQRGTERWLIDIDSGPIAGAVSLPRRLATRAQVRAHLERLHITTGRGGTGLANVDPRTLPGLLIEADEFVLGSRRFGSVAADIEAEPQGLRMVSFTSSGESLSIEGTGGWFQRARGAETQVAFNLRSTDVASSLSELGFDRFAEGQGAELTASVRWPGPPTGDWAAQISGAAALRATTGSLLDIEPGAGRVMGLMSITALPRRLSLDFRDVVNRGLVFDEIAGDFTLLEGDAYTDNLKLTGPVVEIGVAGRTGLRDRDYRQQAVVTSEPGKVLPIAGGLIGGPGVGAALLIFTQIFKEPLKGIGRASYCVTGSWDAPAVERLNAEQLQDGSLCADLPPDGVSMVMPR